MARAGRLLVVAIDFGTTYSGYAFSFKSDFEKDPLSITAQNFVTAGEADKGKTMTAKVPTTVLFDPEKNFHSFGYEAQKHHAGLADEDAKEAARWYYFHQFKMKLHRSENIDHNMKLSDHTKKKKLPALKVFSAAIQYLKEHLEKSLVKRRITIRAREISWVLTVPAIWSDEARQFMRKAATQAGIRDEQLFLALEPEAASILCLQEDSRHGAFDISGTGKKVMVVDCGGGTIDVTTYEVCQGARLKEICPPRGGNAAGKEVDESFKNHLLHTFGFDAVTSFSNIETLSMTEEFEICKRSLSEDSTTMTIQIPPTVLESLSTELQRKPELMENISIVRDRLKTKKVIFENFFSKSIDCVTKQIQAVLHEEAARGVHTILLVGGFAECKMLQKQVKEDFGQCRIIIPENPAAAVLKGAVLFRHKPDVIGWRASAFTYGISSYEVFNSREHDPSKKTVCDGEAVCRDVFAAFIHVNDVVAVGHEAMRKTFFPVRSDQKVLVLPIYKSPAQKPVYVTDEGCVKIGEGVVNLGESTMDTKKREIEVAMIVGGVELIIRATDRASRRQVTTVCDFLSK